MTHFDLVTTSGELWRDVIAAEMEELNIKEAYLLRPDEYEAAKAGLDPMHIGADAKRAILDFCNAFTMVYPPNDKDCPALLAGAFLNLQDALGIETVKTGKEVA